MSQPSTTTITLTLPSTPSGLKRSGEGTLLIQRGELGHLQQFRYTSLSELGAIIQKAEGTLIGLELEPPQVPTPPDILVAEADAKTVTEDEEALVEDIPTAPVPKAAKTKPVSVRPTTPAPTTTAQLALF